MNKMLYEGKAKQIYATNKPNQVIVHYKDDATAFNGQKKASIKSKGILNNQISTVIFKYLAKNKISTHLIKQLNERDQLCEKVKILPLEVIVRNIAAGSISKRLAIKEGTKLVSPIFEICYKNDELGDPLINDYHAIALKLATPAQLKTVYTLTKKINQLLISFFKKINLILVDFKIEFGINSKGKILLADEISPDTCRLWDVKTKNKMDKDRFRRNLGNLIEAYQEVFKRMSKKGKK